MTTVLWIRAQTEARVLTVLTRSRAPVRLALKDQRAKQVIFKLPKHYFVLSFFTLVICMCVLIYILDIDECVGVMCANGGTCVDGVNSFSCTCVEGFNGTLCDNGTKPTTSL